MLTFIIKSISLTTLKENEMHMLKEEKERVKKQKKE